MCHANSNQKRSGVAIVISDNIDFKTEIITRDKGHFIMNQGSIHQKVITIIYAPYNRAPKMHETKKAELKGKIDNSTIII